MAKEPELPRYRPVSDTGNGHKVRPDLQTKIVALVITAAFLGVLAYIAQSVVSLNARMTRIETLVEGQQRGFDRLERLLEKLTDEVRGDKDGGK